MSKLIIEKDEIAYDGKYMQTIRRHFKNCETGERGIWEMVRRKTHGRIVCIVPITQKKEVILVKIFRVPAKSWIIEACAGLMDRKGESEELLARRELLEETGYKVGRAVKLMEGPYNSGLTADEIITFLGFGAKKVQEPFLEPSEDIEVIKVPIKRLGKFLKNPPAAAKVDIKLFAVLYHLEKILP